MLFKILRGNESNLPEVLTDGYCYFLKDKHYFYVDYIDDSNTLVRSKLSAEYADKLRYVADGTMVEIAPEEIALKSEVEVKADKATTLEGYGITDAYTEAEVDAKLSEKSDTSHTHDDFSLTQSGFVPAPMVLGGESRKIFLRADGNWETPTDTVYDDTEVRDLINQKADASTVYTEAEVDSLLSGKSDVSHSHDDIYYTEAEVDSLLSGKSDTTHNHDTAIDNKISVHNTNNSAHNDIRALITDLTTKLNNFLDIDDTTTDQLSEVIALINANKGTLESLTTSKINVSDIVDNLTTSSASKVLSAKQGVAIKALIDALQAEFDTHGHEIAEVTGLQTALDSKAASSHGTHVTYSTTAPVMDGTASVGSAATVARSDHKHPTDTSRAAKTDFDNHVSNKSNPHGVTLSQLGVTATADEINIMDGVTATTAELNYVKGVTSSIQTQLNSKSDTGHNHDDRYYTESEVDSKIGVNTTNITNLRTDLTNEITRATKAEEANATANENTQSALDSEIARAKAAESTNATQITNIQTALDNEIARAKAAESTNATAITNTSSTLSALIGSDSGKTVRKIANEELAAQLIPTDAKESLNTLEEISAWIQSHPDDAAAMNKAIAALEEKVDIDNTTVTAYVAASIAALNIGDYATAANLATLAARVTTLESTSHSHDNKTELDKIASGDKAKWDAKQNALTFDTTPTANSTNPVTSGGIKTALDGKAASSHGTHVTYSTATPVMNGTASAGSASTVSRGDHVHPIDTSRAAKTDFDSHVDNKSNPHSVTAAQVGAIPTTEKGAASGVATLGSDGKVPTSQLPTMGGHYAGTSAPSNTNLLWINTGNNTINYYTGSAWKAIGAVFG